MTNVSFRTQPIAFADGYNFRSCRHRGRITVVIAHICHSIVTCHLWLCSLLGVGCNSSLCLKTSKGHSQAVTGVADSLFSSPNFVLRSNQMNTKLRFSFYFAMSPSAGCWRMCWIVVFLLIISAISMSKPVNPCGMNHEQVLESSENEIEIPTVKPLELFNNIALQALLAKEHADSVNSEFVLDAFKDPLFPTYSTDLHYDWLPHPSTPNPQDLESLEVKEALKQSYETLQHYAVGLEQLVMDQILHGGDFLDQFRQLEGKLRQVLCELHLAMIEMKIKQNPDVHRVIMDHLYRDLDSKTARDLRDSIILRDYIGALDFVSVVFMHFKTKTDTILVEKKKNTKNKYSS